MISTYMPQLSNRLQIRDFRLVRAIAETGQLALAAEQLGITQPAASRMLAAIERTIGTSVFQRHPKGMTVTPMGEILARNAITLLNGMEQTAREVEAVGGGRSGTIRVGSVTGGAVAHVVPAIQRLKRDATRADIHIDVAPSDVLIDGLLGGDFDFVLSRIPAGTDARQFIVRRGRVEVINFLIRTGHPLDGCRTVTLEELEGYEWVIQAPHTPMRQAVEEAFLARSISLPREIVNSTSLLVMIAYLTSTDAIAPVSREVADLLGAGQATNGFARLEPAEPLIVNPYHLIARKNHALSPLAAKLWGLILAGLSGEPDTPLVPASERA